MSDGIRPLDLGRVTIGSTCPPEMAAFIRDTPRRMADEQAAWVADLRAAGVKAAHPDDGWVDRAANTVQLAYATFNDNLQVGDLLALGSPWDRRPTRIVRVTRRQYDDEGLFCVQPRTLWHFESDPRPEASKG